MSLLAGTRPNGLGLYSSSGQVQRWLWLRGTSVQAGLGRRVELPLPGYAGALPRHWLGFGYSENAAHHADGLVWHQRAITIPIWLPIAVLWVSPLVYAVRRACRRSSSKGRCEACRYDLTGNISGVCPECGTKIPPEQQARCGRSESDAQNETGGELG